jgi:flagellar biosynthesis/type III secretory pathway protein FliH
LLAAFAWRFALGTPGPPSLAMPQPRPAAAAPLAVRLGRPSSGRARGVQNRRAVDAKLRILKAAAPLPERRIPAAVHDADRRVREMIAAAEGEARRVRAEAEATRQAIGAEAREEGRREGLAAAAAALALAASERDRLLADAERELASLALAIARKVLGSELAAREAAVADLAARALAEVRERREVVLRVNPGDAPAIGAAEGRLGAILARARLAIREDAAVPRGGVVVDTEAGRLDGGIEAQLEHLGRALAEAVPR